MRKAASMLFAGNLVSKLLGLGREVLVAALFGTGQTIGAFRIAQAGTAVPINFFTSDSLNSAFIPLYKQYQNESIEKARIFFWSLLGLFAILSLSLSIGLWLAAEVWVGLLAPGVESDTAQLAAGMIQVMSIGIPFYIFSALLNYLSIAHNDFLPMAIRPLAQNVGLIVGATVAYVMQDAMMFAWSFTLSFAGFSVWNLCRALRNKVMAFPTVFNWIESRALLKAFWLTLRPLLLLPIFLQGNIVVERIVASLIGIAAISSLDYARFVTETVILLISVPIAFAGLSHWSGLSSDAIRVHLKKTLAIMLLVAIPFSFFLAKHSHLVVEFLYARGAFDPNSVRMTGDILFGVSLGLWAQVVGYVLIKGLNAQMRNQTVLAVMIVALLANAIFNLTMHPYLGALTLGLGNTAYGLVLLAGALTALKLWRDIILCGWTIALGSLGYLVIDSWLPLPKNVFGSVLMAGSFAIVYWLILISLAPSLRSLVKGILMQKRGEKP